MNKINNLNTINSTSISFKQNKSETTTKQTAKPKDKKLNTKTIVLTLTGLAAIGTAAVLIANQIRKGRLNSVRQATEDLVENANREKPTINVVVDETKNDLNLINKNTIEEPSPASSSKSKKTGESNSTSNPETKESKKTNKTSVNRAYETDKRENIHSTNSTSRADKKTTQKNTQTSQSFFPTFQPVRTVPETSVRPASPVTTGINKQPENIGSFAEGLLKTEDFGLWAGKRDNLLKELESIEESAFRNQLDNSTLEKLEQKYSKLKKDHPLNNTYEDLQAKDKNPYLYETIGNRINALKSKTSKTQENLVYPLEPSITGSQIGGVNDIYTPNNGIYGIGTNNIYNQYPYNMQNNSNIIGEYGSNPLNLNPAATGFNNGIYDTLNYGVLEDTFNHGLPGYVDDFTQNLHHDNDLFNHGTDFLGN